MVEMEHGKIYYIDYGSNTQVIGKYRDSSTCNHNFYDLLHYWNGYESFRKDAQYCVKSGIENIRPASQSEKMALIRFEIENDCI